MKLKQVGSTAVSICFGSPRLGDTIKANCMERQIVDPEIFLISTFEIWS